MWYTQSVGFRSSLFPYIYWWSITNGIKGLANHCFALCTFDEKQYTSINGLNSDLTNIYGLLKMLISDCHFFLTYISDPLHHFAQMMQAWILAS